MAYERESVSVTTTQMALLLRLLGAYEEVCTEDISAAAGRGDQYTDNELKRIRAERAMVQNMQAECQQVIDNAAPGFRSHLRGEQTKKGDIAPVTKPARKAPTRTAALPGRAMVGQRTKPYYEQ